jgi:hypothetical protein
MGDIAYRRMRKPARTYAAEGKVAAIRLAYGGCKEPNRTATQSPREQARKTSTSARSKKERGYEITGR